MQCTNHLSNCRGRNARCVLLSVKVSPSIPYYLIGCADGRFLTLGRQLRLGGYSGHIRAAGPLVPDQFPMALKLGIDSVEISTEHAARCTEGQWIAHATRTQGGYQRRLAG